MKNFKPPDAHDASPAPERSALADRRSRGAEQRTSVRKSLNLVLFRLTAGTRVTLCRVRNISSQGLMVESAFSFRCDENVGIAFPKHSLSGTVAWTRERFAGVKTIRTFSPEELIEGYASAADRTAWEHEFVTQLGDVLASLVIRARSPNDVECHLARLRFSQALRAHLKYEDWFVYPALMKDADGTTASIVARLQAEGRDLDERHNAYTRRWVSTTIQDDWEGFRRETGELLQALRHRTTDKEALLNRPLTLRREAPELATDAGPVAFDTQRGMPVC